PGARAVLAELHATGEATVRAVRRLLEVSASLERVIARGLHALLHRQRSRVTIVGPLLEEAETTDVVVRDLAVVETVRVGGLALRGERAAFLRHEVGQGASVVPVHLRAGAADARDRKVLRVAAVETTDRVDLGLAVGE